MIKAKKHLGKILDHKDGVKVIDCRTCGFVHVSPLPTDEELKEFYEKEFYQYARPNYFKETKEDLSWWLATYNHYYEIFERLTAGRTLFDIGSGPGHFLACGKKRGWKVLGIEPSTVAADYCNKRGLTTINDFFHAERAKGLGTFDVVHAALVLEHVPNPTEFIREMKTLVKPGGHLAIFCPNDYNPLQKILREQHGFKPWWVVPKHHVNYFTPVSMKKLLEKLGFKVEVSLGTFPLETFLLAGKNYVGNHVLGRACHKQRKDFESMLYRKNSAILDDLYGGLIQAGIGREFLLIAKKK